MKGYQNIGDYFRPSIKKNWTEKGPEKGEDLLNYSIPFDFV